MMSNVLLQDLSHQEIKAAAAEALEWRRKGVLEGEALRQIARRLVEEVGIPANVSLRMADNLIIEEAAARYVTHI